MTKLTTKRRKSLPSKDFALPDKRKYPLDTKNRAVSAKGRATQAVKTGRMSKSTEAKIDQKADRKLGIRKGSRVTPNTKVFKD